MKYIILVWLLLKWNVHFNFCENRNIKHNSYLSRPIGTSRPAALATALFDLRLDTSYVKVTEVN